MPKKTFLNISKEKKEKITKVAIEEFAKYTYLNASINRIVENSEIAKGSFYQYFEDKKDMYEYILEVAWKKKNEVLSDVLKKTNTTGFFNLLREIYIAEFKFAIDFSEYALILSDFEKNYKNEIKKENIEGKLYNNKIYEDLIIQGIDNGDIDKNIDVEFVKYLLSSLSLINREYLSIENKHISNIKATRLIDKSIDFIKSGIKFKRRTVKNVEDRFY